MIPKGSWKIKVKGQLTGKRHASPGHWECCFDQAAKMSENSWSIKELNQEYCEKIQTSFKQGSVMSSQATLIPKLPHVSKHCYQNFCFQLKLHTNRWIWNASELTSPWCFSHDQKFHIIWGQGHYRLCQLIFFVTVGCMISQFFENYAYRVMVREIMSMLMDRLRSCLAGLANVCLVQDTWWKQILGVLKFPKDY